MGPSTPLDFRSSLILVVVVVFVVVVVVVVVQVAKFTPQGSFIP